MHNALFMHYALFVHLNNYVEYVHQAGKGVLGRLVRYCRIVNALTSYHARPSPNAEEILRRAQQAALHTKMDCVWGFTQIGIDERTQKLLTLVTTRGLLRPKVLNFGAKQGPAIFQSLMDSTFGDLKPSQVDNL